MNPPNSTIQATTTNAFPDDARFILRDAADLLEQAADQLDPDRHDADYPAAVDLFRWAVMKVVEANALLPEDLQGDLSPECFQRNPLH